MKEIDKCLLAHGNITKITNKEEIIIEDSEGKIKRIRKRVIYLRMADTLWWFNKGGKERCCKMKLIGLLNMMNKFYWFKTDFSY